MAALLGRKVRIYGRVQGVFFRQWALGQARALGVSGWVRNCPDGSVEAHLIGDEAKLSEMIEGLRHGPPNAHVEGLVVDDAKPEEVEGFSVRL